jgi:hypothetical protein
MALVPALKQMLHRSMTSVIALGIDAVELAHPLGDLCLKGFDNQMIMVAHQTVRMAEPVKAVNDLLQTFQEGVAIPIVIDNIFSGVAAGRHRVNRSVKLQSKRAGHDLISS